MRLQWNAGGWFGSQIGGTVWILVAAALSAFHDVSAGVILLVVFGIPNILGYLLWRKKSLTCYAATQILVAVMGVCSLLAIYILDRVGLWREIQTGGSISAASGYFVVGIVFAAVMLMFYVRFGRDADKSHE